MYAFWTSLDPLRDAIAGGSILGVFVCEQSGIEYSGTSLSFSSGTNVKREKDCPPNLHWKSPYVRMHADSKILHDIVIRD